MTRDEIVEDVLKVKSKNILLLHCTSTGKTNTSLELTKDKHNVLIAHFETSHKENILHEIDKFGFNRNHYTFTTYRALHKHIGDWDAIIIDEAHHLTEKSVDLLKKCKADRIIYLSASVGKKINLIKDLTPDVYTHEISTEMAIEWGLLPVPTIQIHWIKLGTERNTTYHKSINPKYKKTITYDEWESTNKFGVDLTVICSEEEKYKIIQDEFNSLTDKRDNYYTLYQETHNPEYLNSYLKFKKIAMYRGLDRKRFISSVKSVKASELFKTLTGKRLFFTETIEEAKKFYNSVHIKNKKEVNEKRVKEFKEGKINNLICVKKLQESHNIPNLEHVILQQIDYSSMIKFIQIRGRAMRDEGTILHVFLVKDTVDEEIYNQQKGKLW